MGTGNAKRTPSGSNRLPPCPITGKPAVRRIHGVSARLIEDLWRRAHGTDVTHLFKGIDRLTLFESPTGLVFFEPRIIGDAKFYDAFYRTWDVHTGLTYSNDQRADYKTSARHIPDGAKVIDVGCGPGAFREHLRHAHYTGLDPYAAPEVDDVVIRETLEVHAEKHAGFYDVATAYHVIEHVADPRRHAELMVKLIKPGGLLILAAPLHPSILTEIPNLPMNIPPHHVTWWNPSAFAALARELGLEVVQASTSPASPHQAPIYWMRKLLWRRTDEPPHERYIAHRWSWHISLALAYYLSKVVGRFVPMPENASSIDAFLIARKPA